MPNTRRTLASQDGGGWYHHQGGASDLGLAVYVGGSRYAALRSFVSDIAGEDPVDGSPIYGWFHNTIFPASAPSETPAAPTAESITSPAWRIRVTVGPPPNTTYGIDVRLYRASNNQWIGHALVDYSSSIQSVNFDFDSSENGTEVYATQRYITAPEYMGPASSASNITTITDLA